MSNKKALKSMLVLLTVLLLSALASISAFAREGGTPFSFEVFPEKQEYAKGEQIVFVSEMHNVTMDDIENVVVSAEMPESKSYLTPGTSEHDYEFVEGMRSVQGKFKFSEFDNIVSAGEAIAGFSALLGGFFLFLVRKYTRLSTIYVTVLLVLTTTFSSFSMAFSNLFSEWEKSSLDSCSVVYDGEELVFGFNVFYKVPKNSDKFVCETAYLTDGGYTYDTSVTASESGCTGVLFNADIGAENFTGSIFYINTKTGVAGIAHSDENGYSSLAHKKVSIEAGEAYRMVVSSEEGRTRCWLYNNPLDASPYPLFDFIDTSTGDSVGVRRFDGDEYTKGEISSATPLPSGATYTNPVLDDLADPYVLNYNGLYYLYGTSLGDGFEAWTSTDLVNWERAGRVASASDIVGTKWFWAPEVYHYNEKFYMFYSAEEQTCVAVADSPLGPFVSPTDRPLFDFKAIDSSVFFDTDGKIYLYFARLRHDEGKGQQLWGCELNRDLLSVKADTLTFLTEPEDWEKNVNEGPLMLKHNGYYYLTYSGDDYRSIDYGSAYAVSASPLGGFEKHKNNPILDSDTFIHGTGHHCFATSPDGSEMFIIYHCHYSLTAVQVRKLCMDRIKFVPSPDGVDILTIYGPTVTSQPIPSNQPLD